MNSSRVRPSFCQALLTQCGKKHPLHPMSLLYGGGGYFDFWSKKDPWPINFWCRFVKNEVCFLLERLRDPRRRPGSRSSDSSPVLSPDLRTQREVGRHDDQERRRRLSPVRPEAALRQIHRKNQDQSTSTILHCPGKSLWWGLSWIV